MLSWILEISKSWALFYPNTSKDVAESREIPPHMARDTSPGRTAVLGATLSKASQFLGTVCQGEELEPPDEAGRVIEKWRNLEKGGKIILSFPQILLLFVQLFVWAHRNKRAARDSPREEWEVIYHEM